MPEIRVNTDNFKKDYPFLEKIWNLYEEFNQTVDHTDNDKVNYDSMCDKIMQNVHDEREWYKDLCIKLMRNLGTFSSVYNKSIYNSERCKNINSWLYYIIKDYEVNQAVITNIFEESNKIVVEGSDKFYCYNYLYKDKYDDPDKIIMLINLEDYMNDFLSILKDNNANNHCLCRKFIFECAKIYRDMNNEYCVGPTINRSRKPNTCSQLESFKLFYTSFISTIVELKGKLPSLYSEENELIPKCSSDIGNQEQKLDSSGVDQSNSNKKISISTAIGTMAGIPPFLALIYKFTPVGTWFRSKNRKSTDVFKNIDEEIEKELYYPRHENANINSSQARYNVAYEQIYICNITHNIV